jgi:hypothetical protein
MRWHRPGRRDGSAGQALVEFAIALPIFLLALFGVVDAGRLVYVNSALSQAAREGARLGATEAAWVGIAAPNCVSESSDIGSANPGAHVCPADPAAFKAHVVEAVNRMAVGLGPISDVHLSCDKDDGVDAPPSGDWTDDPGGDGNGCMASTGGALGSAGDTVSVRVELTYEPTTPFISSIIGSVALSGSATMVVH